MIDAYDACDSNQPVRIVNGAGKEALTWPSCLLVSMMLLFATTFGLGLAWGQEEEEREESSRTIAVEGSTATDGALRRRIDEILRELGGIQDVSVNVDGGVVTLRGEAIDGEAIDQAVSLVNRVEGVVTIKNEVTLSTSVTERIEPAFDRFISKLYQALTAAPLLIVAASIVGLFFFAGVMLTRWEHPWRRISPNVFIADLIKQIVRIAFIVIGIVVALDFLGATAVLGSVLGAAGIFGLAIGFAVRDTVENYIASILLSLRQPFRPNDLVVIDDFEGHVVRLTSRATVLLTLDGNHVRIPNANVFKAIITNFSSHPERRFDFALGVDADSNLSDALDVGSKTIQELGFVLHDPPSSGWVSEVGDSNVIITFFAWIDQRRTDINKARSECIRLVKNSLECNGFSLPEPIYRLRIEGGDFGQSEVRVSPSPKPEEPTDVREADAERALTQKVMEEQSETGSENLLNDAAPQE